MSNLSSNQSFVVEPSAGALRIGEIVARAIFRSNHVDTLVLDEAETAKVCAIAVQAIIDSQKRTAAGPPALRDALESIASPSRPEDYGWWTQVARRALGFATKNETALPSPVRRRPTLEESNAWTSAEEERDWWRSYAMEIEQRAPSPPAASQDAVRLRQFIESAAEQCNCADVIVDLRAALAGEWLYQQLPGWDPNNPTARPAETKEAPCNDRVIPLPPGETKDGQ